MIDVRKTFHCSERCPRIPCKKLLGRRFLSGRVLLWSPLRPCLQQPSSEGNSPSLSSAHRQSEGRSVARRAETFSCAKDGNGSDPWADVSQKVSADTTPSQPQGPNPLLTGTWAEGTDARIFQARPAGSGADRSCGDLCGECFGQSRKTNALLDPHCTVPPVGTGVSTTRQRP